MKPTRKLTRRSFLGRVAGGVAGGAALIATGIPEAEAFQVTDNDTGSNADPVGRGRGNRRRGQRACTDNDRGANSDPAGRGRGNGRTDSDSGRNADRAGCGRR